MPEHTVKPRSYVLEKHATKKHTITVKTYNSKLQKNLGDYILAMAQARRHRRGQVCCQPVSAWQKYVLYARF